MESGEMCQQLVGNFNKCNVLYFNSKVTNNRVILKMFSRQYRVILKMLAHWMYILQSYRRIASLDI